MIFLVDGDNNIGTGLQGIDLLTEEDTVLVFFGKGQTLSNVKKLCAGTRAQVQYLESVKGGKNSLDFQIITELGVLVGRGEADFAYVISQDKGYEAAMSALHARYASTFREVALRPSIQDCLQAAFLLRSNTLEELSGALTRQFGPVQGQLAYDHLAALFAPTPEPELPAAPEEQKPAKAKKRRNRSKAEEPAPQPAQEAPQAEPAETTPAPPSPAAAAPAAAGSGRSGPRPRKKPSDKISAKTAPGQLAGRRCALFLRALRIQGPQQGLHCLLHHPDRLLVPVPQQVRHPLHGRAGVPEEDVVGVDLQQAAQADKVLQPGAVSAQLNLRHRIDRHLHLLCQFLSRPMPPLSGCSNSLANLFLIQCIVVHQIHPSNVFGSSLSDLISAIHQDKHNIDLWFILMLDCK